jgi:AmiR/NasT family two-component response regulator
VTEQPTGLSSHENLPTGATPAPDSTTIHGSDLHERLAQVEEQNRQLRDALTNAREIGAAIGIVMSSHRLTHAAAFERLTLLSQRTHRKLRDIATDIVDTGEVPG